MLYLGLVASIVLAFTSQKKLYDSLFLKNEKRTAIWGVVVSISMFFITYFAVKIAG